MLIDTVYPILAAGSSGKLTEFTGNELLTWLGILSFCMFLANQLLQFWRANLRTLPATSEVARDLIHLEKSISAGMQRVEETVQRQIKRIEQESVIRLDKLEHSMNSRFEAAFKSRSNLHKEHEKLRERVACTEVEIEHLKQTDAISKITRQ